MKSLAERFWQNVSKSDDCWLWTGKSVKRLNGYGQLHVAIPDGPRGPDGRSGRRNVLAHRLSWEMANGKIPLGLEVCHSCDNPLCVRPSHLFLGTHKENMRDAMDKQRNPRGERFPHSKLTESSVSEIRARYSGRGCGVTQQQLADEFGVSISQVNGILRGRGWKHVA